MIEFRIVQQQLDIISFANGYKAHIKQEMTAGDEDVLRNYMLRMESSNGDKPQMVLQMGDMKLVEINLVKLTDPQGAEIPVTPELVRSLDRRTFRQILTAIQERNPPLA
jgi:hypothetical protein